MASDTGTMDSALVSEMPLSVESSHSYLVAPSPSPFITSFLCLRPRFQMQLVPPATYAWETTPPPILLSSRFNSPNSRKHLHQDSPLALRFNQVQVFFSAVPNTNKTSNHLLLTLPPFSQLSTCIALRILDFISLHVLTYFPPPRPMSLESFLHIHFLCPCPNPELLLTRPVITFPLFYFPIHAAPKCRVTFCKVHSNHRHHAAQQLPMAPITSWIKSQFLYIFFFLFKLIYFS